MILVAGATGSLGSKIVHGLRERGDAVRALVRPTADPRPLEAAGASIVFGDLRDPASLDHACDGASAVITTASASKTGDDSVEKPWTSRGIST